MRAAGLVVACVIVGCGGGHAPVRPVLPSQDVSPRPAPEPAPDLTLPVSAIVVTGLPAERARAAWALIQSKVGVPVVPRQLRRDAQAIWGLGGIADIRIRAAESAGAVSVTFEVIERSRIGEVDIDGIVLGLNHFHVHGAFGVASGDLLDPSRLARGGAELTTAYQNAGFRFAEVGTPSVTPGDDDTVDVTVAVVEGPLVTIRSLSYRGNQRFTAAELDPMLTGATGAIVGEPYRAGLISDGLALVIAEYYDQGHIRARTDAAEETFSADRTEVDLVIPIDEGPRFTVGKVTVKGDLIASEKKYLQLLGIKRGAGFDRSAITAGIARVTAFHRKEGKPEPRIDPLTQIDDVGHVVDITLVVAGRLGP